jgi:hypothetical protein
MRSWREQLNRLAAAATILAMAFGVSAAQAATVTSANDVPTTLRAGQLSDHDVTFVTPTGAAEGTTMTLTFDAAFGTSTIIEDDVDLSDNGTPLTTAPDCSGSEQASVAMASHVLTLTICPGDGGAVLAGHSVEVKIGDNTTSSGTGTHRITNPSGAGTYYINIGGTFGDSGSIPLPIGAADGFAVTATVSGNGGGGGGGGGGGPPPPPAGDTTPPVISNIQAVNITETSATITWDTDEPATSRVDYGPTIAYELGSVIDGTLVTSHSVNLTGLSASTQYHFRVRSTDASANERFASDMTFTTAIPNPPPGNVSGLTATPGDGQVSFSWTNPPDGDLAGVKILRCTNGPPSSANDPSCTVVFDGAGSSFIDTGLANGTTFFYGAFAFDSAGQFASGALVNATPEAVNQPPGNVTGLTVTPGEAQLLLAWSNPSDPDLVAIRVLRCANVPSGPNDGSCTVIFNALGTSVVDTGLTDGVTYHYGVYAEDSVGQFSTGALGQGTPSAPVEELPPPPVAPPPAPQPQPVPGGQPVVCGDHVCSQGESTASCALDCPSGLASADTLRQDLTFFVGSGTIPLTPTASQVVEALAGSSLEARLLALHLEKPVARVELAVGGQRYLMSRTATDAGDAYVATVTAPETPSTFLLTIDVLYADATAQTVSLGLGIKSPGYVYADIGGVETRIGASLVTLSTGGAVWDGSPYGEFNPVTTGADGTFGWYVPNGTYVLSATKDGYLPAQTDVVVTNNILNTRLAMTSVVVPPPVPPLPFLPPAAQQTLNVLGQGLASIQANPTVQTAATASVPALAVTAALSGLTLAFGFNLLPFLELLFTSPILLFGRRRRHSYGVIYNALTKLPVDLATVRLFRLPDLAPPSPGAPEIGRLVQSRVTDRGGRYFFSVDPGRYRLQVMKTDLAFPSDVLKDKTVDHDYLDLYHGEPISVTGSRAVIAANIPLDPAVASGARVPARIVLKARLRTLQNAVAVLGLLVSIAFAILQPNVLTIAMVALQVLVYLVVRRLARPAKPKNWGIVYDKASQKPLSRVIARVFEPQYNKLLDTAVTDASGRYNFVLGPNEYYVVFEKEGYEPVEVRPVDYSARTQPTEFGVKVALPPKQANA